jgi:hypothetical protein
MSTIGGEAVEVLAPLNGVHFGVVDGLEAEFEVDVEAVAGPQEALRLAHRVAVALQRQAAGVAVVSETIEDVVGVLAEVEHGVEDGDGADVVAGEQADLVVDAVHAETAADRAGVGLAVLTEAAAIRAAALGLPAEEAVVAGDVDNAGQKWRGEFVELYAGLFAKIVVARPVDAGDRPRLVAGEKLDEDLFAVAADEYVGVRINALQAVRW